MLSPNIVITIETEHPAESGVKVTIIGRAGNMNANHYDDWFVKW